jgi:hypothetical protein
MKRHSCKTFVFALLAMIVPVATGHAAMLTDEFTVTGSNFTSSSAQVPAPFSTFNAVFDITFDPAISTNAMKSGFTLKSASFGDDPNYYGFKYFSPADGGPSFFVGGVDPTLGIIDSTGHFNLCFGNHTGCLGDLSLIIADPQFGDVQFFAGNASFSASEVSATPLPPSVLMFGAALVALGAFGWRRQKQLS